MVKGVGAVGELDDVVMELCRRHPRFPRATITRLVSRIADTCTRAAPGLSPEALPSAVREVAEEQLRYLDEGQPAGRRRRPTPGMPHLPTQR